jgi:predicted Na+-dependent transporter
VGATTLALCGTTTLVLYGATTVILYGIHHPLWLCFHLIGWFGLLLGFGLSFGDIFGLWQHCEAIILGRVVSRSISPINELILGWVFRINSHSK